MMRRIVTLTAAGLATLGLAPAVQAQSSPSAYTSATRYDLMGRVTGTIAAAAPTQGYPKFLATRTTYDDVGRPTKVETGYLAAWQSESVAPESWSGFTIMKTVETTYNAQNQKLTEKVREQSVGGTPGPVFGLTQYSYDTSGRILCTAVRMNPAIYGSPPSSACTLGTAGTEGPDRITKNIYDVASQMVQLREGVGTAIEAAEVTYSYTNNGKIQEVVDAGGHRSLMCYDGLDRKKRWVFPSTTNPSGYIDYGTIAQAISSANAASTTCSGTTGDYEEYSYDPNGNRTALRKRDAQVINYSYDNLNRMTVKDIPNSTPGSSSSARDVYYGYNARGLNTSILFDSSSGEGITNDFNGFDRMVSSTTNMDGNIRTLGYYYDYNGNLARLTHPDSNYVDYVMDGMDRLYYAAVNNNPLFLPVKDDAGRLNGLYRWDGSSWGPVTGFSYEPTSRVLAYTHFFNFTTTSYNSTTSFAYNPAGQITATDRNNDLFAWNGQAAVNRNYTANGLNQYTAAGASAYCYDANGNLTADGTHVYKYDVENRLIEMRAQVGTCGSLQYTGALKASLRYDPMGRLHEATDGATSVRTRFLHDRDMLLAEYDVAMFGSGGSILRRYVHGTDAGDDPRVWFEGSTVNDSARRYLWPDERGSTMAVTNNTGNVTAVGAYDEYGMTDTSGNDIATRGRFRYTGQAWLHELGMYYYKARIYSPLLGRFLQTDPIGYDDQFNLYAYVGNDPVNGTDPTGRYECHGSSSQCKDFKVFRKNLSDAAHQPKTGSIVRDSRLAAANKTLGREGDGGVNITFSPETGAKTMGSFSAGSNTINLDYEKIVGSGTSLAQSSGMSKRKAVGLVGGAVLAHEAYHATWSSPSGLTQFDRGRAQFFDEYAAYEVEQNYYRAWEMSAAFGSGNLARRAYNSCLTTALTLGNPSASNQHEAGCVSGNTR